MGDSATITAAGNVSSGTVTAGTASITAQAGNISNTTVSASSSGTLLASNSITGVNLTTPTGSLTATTGSIGASVNGGSFSTSSGSSTTLTSNIASLTSTAGTNILVNEADAITLVDVKTANGSITITSGGPMVVTSVVSQTDRDNNDIRLTANTGDLTVGVVNAGTTAGDVTLTATTGAIIDDVNDSVIDVFGDVLTLTAKNGIGQIGPNGSLDIAANSLIATVTGPGLINIAEKDAITLTDVRTSNGPITISSGGAMLATSVVSQTDNDANDISLTVANGDLTIGVVNAGVVAGDVTLTVLNGNLFMVPTPAGMPAALISDNTGTFNVTPGNVGTSTVPLSIRGTGIQTFNLRPGAFSNVNAVNAFTGNLLPVVGAFNLDTATGAAGGQRSNDRISSYIDLSIITANYRSYGVVPSGVRLPQDQLIQKDCPKDQPDCSDE